MAEIRMTDCEHISPYGKMPRSPAATGGRSVLLKLLSRQKIKRLDLRFCCYRINKSTTFADRLKLSASLSRCKHILRHVFFDTVAL